MRLIDADELLKKTAELEAEALEQVVKYYTSEDLEEWRSWSATLAERTAFKHDIMDTPTVDAVEVVRCKDCVYCKRFNDVWYSPKRDELLCTRYVETYHTTENNYCSWAERKKDDN